MSGEESSSHTRQEIGQTLEGARRERGLSLEEVEQATKIRVRYLRDLENENFDALPTVYMLGSLKTYARFLGLDEEALAGEFKRRQALLQEEQSPSQEEPQPEETRGLLASLGRLLGVGSLQRGKDEAGTVPGHSPRLYVSLGVVLIFILATALASSLGADDRPTVSQVRETKISTFPSMIALAGDLEDDGRNVGTANKENRPEDQAKSPARDAGKDDEAERSEQNQETAQASSSSATASASASATVPSAGSASASARTTPASDGPEPAATEEPEGDGGDVADAAPARPSARAPGGPGLQQKRQQAGPAGAIQLGNRISSQVKITVHSPR